MTAQAPARELFCLKCTRPAPFWQPTIDADHPEVRCVRRDRDGNEYGCGVQPGTYEEAEAVAVVRERRRVIANAHHREHVQYHKPNALCDECQKAPPDKPVAPHAFESFARKYRTAAHVEFVHHNRDMLPRLPMRTAQELEGHHRALHEKLDQPLGGA